MELRQLNYFLTICETKNFTRAAERLFVSQPALTNQIIALEEELGMRLLERTKKNVKITPAGEVFRRHALQVMSEVDSTLVHINEIKSSRAKNVSLTIHPFLSRLYFRELYALIAAQCRGSAILFTNLSDSQIESQFSDRNYSLRLSLGVRSRGAAAASVLAHSRMVCVAAAEEGLRQENPLYVIPGNAGRLTAALTSLLPQDARLCLVPFIDQPEEYLVSGEYVIIMPEAGLASPLPCREFEPELFASIELSGADSALIARMAPLLSTFLYDHGWEVDTHV